MNEEYQTNFQDSLYFAVNLFNENKWYEAHDALTCIGEKSFIDDKNRHKLSDQHFLKRQEEIARIYSDIPEALENNYNFHLRFNFKPKKSISSKNISSVFKVIFSKKINL